MSPEISNNKGNTTPPAQMAFTDAEQDLYAGYESAPPPSATDKFNTVSGADALSPEQKAQTDIVHGDNGFTAGSGTMNEAKEKTRLQAEKKQEKRKSDRLLLATLAQQREQEAFTGAMNFVNDARDVGNHFTNQGAKDYKQVEQFHDAIDLLGETLDDHELSMDADGNFENDNVNKILETIKYAYPDQTEKIDLMSPAQKRELVINAHKDGLNHDGAITAIISNAGEAHTTTGETIETLTAKAEKDLLDIRNNDRLSPEKKTEAYQQIAEKLTPQIIASLKEKGIDDKYIKEALSELEKSSQHTKNKNTPTNKTNPNAIVEVEKPPTINSL